NCEQLIPTPDFTTVMISQGVGEYKKGDKVNAMISGSAAGIGLVYKKPAGEPAVPKVIFLAWKIEWTVAGSIQRAAELRPMLSSVPAVRGRSNRSRNTNYSVTGQTDYSSPSYSPSQQRHRRRLLRPRIEFERSLRLYRRVVRSEGRPRPGMRVA